MNIEIGRQEHVTVIEMADRVDAKDALVFAEVVAQEVAHGHYDLVIDMAGVDYIGSAGLRQLMATYHQMRRKGGDVRLARPSYTVLEILEICGLSKVFQTFSTQLEAVRSY